VFPVIISISVPFFLFLFFSFLQSQSIQVSVNLLSKLASLSKIDPVVFRASWVPILVQLWGMSDRTVRTVMLQSLKALVPFVPEAIVNKSIFDNVLAGFADSNAK